MKECIRYRKNRIEYGYYQDGKFIRHRVDLPAVEDVKCKYWYLHGKRHRDNDLPAVENANGDKAWYVDGRRHRDNGLPAIERADGRKYWYVHGQRIKINITQFTNEELIQELSRRLQVS